MVHRIGPTPRYPQQSGIVTHDIQAIYKAFFDDSVDLRSRLSGVLPKDGTERMEAPLPFQIIATVGGLPPAATWEGALVYIDSAGNLAYSDGVNWFQLPVLPTGEVQAPQFRAHKNGTDQTGLTAGSFQTITFGTEQYDIDGFFASNTWTPPAGLVHIGGAFQATSTPAGFPTIDPVFCAIFKNGSEYARGQGLVSTALNTGSAQVHAYDRANGTDAYTLRAFITSVGAASTATLSGITALTYFQGAWIHF